MNLGRLDISDPLAPRAAWSRRTLISAAVAIALLRGVTGQVGLPPGDTVATDEFQFGFEQGHIAGNLARGNGFVVKFDDSPAVPTAWSSPLYPLLLAGVFKATAPFTASAARAVIWINAACHGIIGAMLLVLGTRLATQRHRLSQEWDAVSVQAARRVGLAAAAIFVLMPAGWQFLHWAWCVHMLAVFVLWHLCVVTAAPQFPWRYGMAAGISMALALLTDATVITLLPITALCMLYRLHGRKLASAMATCGLAAAVLLAPWTIRNAVVLHRVTPLRGMLGTALWMGNHPTAEAERYHGVAVSPFHQTEARAEFAQLGEAGFDRAALQRFVETTREDPARFVQATWRRATGFWFGEWWAWWRDYPAIYNIGRGILPLLAICGAWRARQFVSLRPWLAVLLLFPLPYYITFLSYGRYRFPIEPVLCLLAALNAMPRATRASRERHAARSTAALTPTNWR